MHEKKVLLRAIGTKENTADLGTKPLPSERIRHLLGLMGFFNADGLLNSVKVQQVQHVRHITQPSTHHTRLLQMSTFLLALALSRGEEDAMGDNSSENSNLAETESNLEVWEQLILVSQLLWATFGELYSLGVITAGKYNVTGDKIILGVVLMILIYGMVAWARSMTTPTSSASTSSSSTRRTRFASWTRSMPRSSSSTLPTTSSRTRPMTSAEPRTTSSSTSALPVRAPGQVLQPTGSSSRTSTTSATASSGDREQREQRYRLLREDFVQQWLVSSEWFPREERLRVCTTSEFGECYHLKSDCPGLRNSKKVFRDPVETVILTRKAPCQICCSDHWVLYEASCSIAAGT